MTDGSPYFNSPQQEAGTLLAPGGSLPLVFSNSNIDAHVYEYQNMFNVNVLKGAFDKEMVK